MLNMVWTKDERFKRESERGKEMAERQQSSSSSRTNAAFPTLDQCW